MEGIVKHEYRSNLFCYVFKWRKRASFKCMKHLPRPHYY